MKGKSQQIRHMEMLSRLVIRGHNQNNNGAATRGEFEKLRRELPYVAGFGVEEFASLTALADTHHVIVRALEVVRSVAALEPVSELPAAERENAEERCERVLVHERARIDRAVGYLHSICEALEARGCQVAVIKSLDHWPDLGSD
ncbi:MAG: hypothetical protein WCB53_08900, partial [Terriglobales bacterium]